MTPETMFNLALWVGLAIVFGLIEVFTVGFFCVFLAAGALVAALVALITDSLFIQTGVFLIASVLFTIYARPLLKNTFQIGEKPAQPSNVHALLGAEALVLEQVDKYNGKVKVVHTGEIWTAYLANLEACELLAAGCPAEVVRVDGAKLAIIPKA